jgi:hypothetical protein
MKKTGIVFLGEKKCMIKVGNIVYLKRAGGTIRESKLITSSVGLVIKEHQETGAITQFYVQFKKRPPQWYYQHDLFKI